jgi:hypothetical protein
LKDDDDDDDDDELKIGMDAGKPQSALRVENYYCVTLFGFY